MAVTDRKLFVGASPKINSRGTGITSGLVDDDSQFSSDFEQQRRILESIRPPQQEFSRFSAASPALLALGSALLSGKSLQGGVGGALDILGQGAGASAPLFGDAISQRRAFEAAQRKEGFDLDLAAYNAALDLSKTRAKGKPGEVKAAWIPNPKYDSTKPISDDNLSHFETTRQAGTDGVTRIRDIIPGSPTFNELVSENNFKGYLVTDPIKLQGLKEGDAWILNPGYSDMTNKDAMNMYLTSQFQTDAYGNTTIKDTRPNSPTLNEYLPKEEFDQISFTKPSDEIDAETNKLELETIKIAGQELFDDVSKRAGVEKRTLTDKEMELFLQQAGTEKGEWNKFSQNYATTINEASEILKQFLSKSIPSPEISIEFGEDKEQSRDNEETYNTKTKDYIDEYYNLNPNDINYDAKRQNAEALYEKKPMMDTSDIEVSLSGFKDIQVINDNIKEGNYPFGFFKTQLANFGIDKGAADFMIAADNLLIKATDALIKGIPSDFDVNNLKKIIPTLSKGDVINMKSSKRLEAAYIEIVKASLRANSGLGFRINPSTELKVREVLGNPAVDEILSTKYNQSQLDEYKSIGNDLNKRKEYMDKYGDPFKRVDYILSLPDSAFQSDTLNEADFQRLLDNMDEQN